MTHRQSATSEGPDARRRFRYIALAIATIAAGLSVHVFGEGIPTAARDAIGDALWAMMMAWWVSAVVPKAPLVTRGSAAFAVTVAVECSQLVHTARLDEIRASVLGHLVLGSDFDPRDLAAYAAGVLVAMLIDRSMLGAGRRP